MNVISVTILTLSNFTMLTSMVSACGSVGVTRRVVPTGLVLLVKLVILFTVLVNRMVRLSEQSGQHSELHRTLTVLVTRSRQATGRGRRTSSRRLHRLVRGPLTVDIRTTDTIDSGDTTNNATSTSTNGSSKSNSTW